MGTLDFIVMVLFALLIFAIGVLFTRRSGRDGKAFFEAGGRTPWWINGLSLFISYFSAGTFVVWGSIAYRSGMVANAIQLTMAVSGMLVALFIAGKWKQAGVQTAAEYIGKRFGSAAQQYYTYLILLYSLVATAAVLYPVGKMVYVATPFSLNTCIILIGLIITFYTAAGGLWAVLVTDVIQFVVLSASVLIIIPIAFEQTGGIAAFFSKAPPGFFKLTDSNYSGGFLLAFVVYQTVYLGGNWSYVQRYTSVGTVAESKKVAWLFTTLYLVSPLIWMIPPMVYRIINPHLNGLEAEGAYMLFCLKVLPPGLIGLVLAGMVSATSSKANTTINLTATAFARDLYKGWLRPAASERSMIRVARLFTLLFGGLTIVVALQIPRAGGIVEMVLSTASIAGGALFAPIIWSLYSRRQTAVSVVTISLVSLIVNIALKLAGLALPALRLTRTPETLFGVGLPILLLAVTELYYFWHGSPTPAQGATTSASARAPAAAANADTAAQNAFGIGVIGVAMAVVGVGIGLLGLLAQRFSMTAVVVGAVTAILGTVIALRSTTKKTTVA